MQEKVLEVRRRILGEEHPDTLRTMHNLASSYQFTRSDEGGGRNAREGVGSEAEDPGGGTSGHAADDA